VCQCVVCECVSLDVIYECGLCQCVVCECVTVDVIYSVVCVDVWSVSVSVSVCDLRVCQSVVCVWSI